MELRAEYLVCFFFIFTVVAFAMLLHPLAPGTGIDVLGGFFFTFVFTENYNMTFLPIYFVTVLILVVFHYAGACIQWWLGKFPFLQIWMNRVLPIVLLASSDATLVDADFIRVGIIGFFWLDTLNGFNQGRINMEFWTQLLSEWTCFPNAFCFGAFGASIAAIGLEEHEHLTWTQTAVPLFILAGSAFSQAGLLWALSVMGSSMKNKTFYTSREKWASIRYFEHIGYAVTKKGWAECDCYQLASDGITPASAGGQDKGLYAEVYKLHLNFVCNQIQVETQKEKLQQVDQYEKDLEEIRMAHWIEVEKNLEQYAKAGLVMKIEPKEHVSSYWDDVAENECKRKFQIFLVVSLVFSFWAMISGLAMGVPIEDAVKKGVGALPGFTGTDILTWFSLAWFTIVYNAYYYAEWYESISSLAKGLVYLFRCCPIPTEMETEFKTPKWQVPAELEKQTLEGLFEEYGEGTKLIDPIENKENLNIIPEYILKGKTVAK